MNQNYTKTDKLTYIALLTAVSTLAVGFLRVPSPYGGIIHFGDSVIFITSIFFGPLAGAFVGGVGHSIANILFGPQIFAPWTLVIKAIMGLVVGIIAHRQTIASVRLWISFVCALAILLVGYFIAATVIFSTGGSAAAPVPLSFAISNSIQWIASVIATVALLPIVNKILRRNKL
ncbi:MAG: ECF transporter S component [Oscillospiraceae bacterium]|nr:ECF transporter S component [Oscillospiraceae bacterium]